MKIKALSRNVEKHTRETSGDIKVVSRNLDPKYKPMERAREYTRAVQAAKLQKVFAKVGRGRWGDGDYGGWCDTGVQNSVKPCETHCETLDG
jgi:WD repeat and SOF domain-containing protein 1